MNIILTLVSQTWHTNKDKINNFFLQMAILRSHWGTNFNALMHELTMPREKPLLEKYFVRKSNSETKCLYVEETLHAWVSVLIQLIFNLWEQKLKETHTQTSECFFYEKWMIQTYYLFYEWFNLKRGSLPSFFTLYCKFNVWMFAAKIMQKLFDVFLMKQQKCVIDISSVKTGRKSGRQSSNQCLSW